MTLHYSDEDMAALQLDVTQIVLHADHTYGKQPWAPRLPEAGKRGLGAEIRILGIDPDAAERRARERGATVLLAARDWPHGWRDVVLEDPDGYTFAVGSALP
jgi:predicted enzyme related to lactoylglutathione lyase